jgi:ribosomal protein L21E
MIGGDTLSASLRRYAIGDRVRLSDLGYKRHPRIKQQLGTVVGFSKGSNGVRVLFDGRASSTILHVSYLELHDLQSPAYPVQTGQRSSLE